MRYMVEKNFVRVVGKIWLPMAKACYEYPLDKFAVKSIGEFTRENVAQWVNLNAGDFSSIDDFYATVGDKEINWEKEESEMFWNDRCGGS